MMFCHATFPTPEENLAFDEYLLNRAERGELTGVLRFWQSDRWFVVVGYGNHVRAEVNLEFCESHHIPVLRRCSGGGTVLQGPGCLNYSLVVPIQMDSPFASISGANRHILHQHREALAPLVNGTLTVEGHSDLALNGLKISGNSQRRKLRMLLFHGTFLLDLDLSMIEKTLNRPSKEPAYRMGRAHRDFITNLRMPADLIQDALINAWDAQDPFPPFVGGELAELVAGKYATPEWNWKF